MAKYIEQRRRRWYAVLDVPAELRKEVGTSRFVRSLGTESKTEAERLVFAVIAEWKAIIHSAKTSGSQHTTMDLNAPLRWRSELEKVSGSPDDYQNLRSLLDDKFVELSYVDENAAKLAQKMALGETFPLDKCAEEWLQSLDNEPKTIDMKRSDLKRLTRDFQFSHELTKQKLQTWTHKLQSEGSLRPATVRRIVSSCRGYWNYLHMIGKVLEGESIFDGASPKKLTKAKAALQDKRKPFLTSEVSSLLTSVLEKGDLDLARLIWIAMWTGCRIEEICSLKLEDVHSSHFEVKDGKTSAGNRLVPIHPKLGRLMKQLVR